MSINILVLLFFFIRFEWGRKNCIKLYQWKSVSRFSKPPVSENQTFLSFLEIKKKEKEKKIWERERKFTNSCVLAWQGMLRMTFMLVVKAVFLPKNRKCFLPHFFFLFIFSVALRTVFLFLKLNGFLLNE